MPLTNDRPPEPDARELHRHALLTARFDEALHYRDRSPQPAAAQRHVHPYAAHLLAVSSLVLEMGDRGRGDRRTAARRHRGRRRPAAEVEIRARFGDDAARIVVANSDADELPKPPWRARKEAYIAAIAYKQPDELRVSLADKLHNARAILLDFRTHGDALWERFNSDADVPWYYRALTEAFEARADALGPGAVAVLGELRRTVGELDRLAAPRR